MNKALENSDSYGIIAQRPPAKVKARWSGLRWKFKTAFPYGVVLSILWLLLFVLCSTLESDIHLVMCFLLTLSGQGLILYGLYSFGLKSWLHA